MDEQPVFVDQIQPAQLRRELAATEEYAFQGRVLELLYGSAQVAADVVAVRTCLRSPEQQSQKSQVDELQAGVEPSLAVLP